MTSLCRLHVASAAVSVNLFEHWVNPLTFTYIDLTCVRKWTSKFPDTLNLLTASAVDGTCVIDITLKSGVVSDTASWSQIGQAAVAIIEKCVAASQGGSIDSGMAL